MKLHQASFPGMHQGEVIIILQRRHWVLMVSKVLRLVVLTVVPAIVVFFFYTYNANFTLEVGAPLTVALTLGGSAYFLFLWLLFFQDWIDFYLDAFLLTNERIVRIEQQGTFNRVVSHLPLDRIQDVTVETRGIISTLFGYGTITVETAGEQENFVFRNFPNVNAIQAQILMYAKQAPRMGIEKPAAETSRTGVNPSKPPTGTA